MSIKRQFATSSLWFVVGQGSSNLVNFAVFALLARLLGPTDFGLVAFAALFIELIRWFAFAGFPQALVQRAGWDDEVSSNAFWGNLILAVVLALILTIAFAPFMAAYYNPRLLWVIPALSLTLLIDAARAAHESKLQRDFDYKSLAKRTLFATTIGGIVGVVLAFFGFGVWALVANRIASSLANTLVIWAAARWIPRAMLSMNVIKPLLSFGLHLSGALVLNQLNSRVAEITVGAFLGPAPVGFYRIGWRAVAVINDAVIQPMNATALSAFSRVNETGSVAGAFLRITKACGALSFPIYFGAAVIAPEFIELCFGHKWQTSGWIMSVLALLGGANTLNNFSSPALTSVGKTRLVFMTNLVALASSAVIALALVRYGVVAVAIGFTARAYLTIPFVLWMLKRGLGLSPADAIKGLLPPFAVAAVMALSLLAIKHFWLSDFGPAARLAMIIPLGAVLYGFGLMLFARRYVEDLRKEVRPLISRLEKMLGGSHAS
jgi:PST family polysaccharide transporter